MDSPTVPEQEPRRYGRGLFLATVAGGVSSLFWGKAAWDHVTGVVSPVAGALAPILPTGGWRIYPISGQMPKFDPATWRLKIGGLVEQPISLTYDELRALPRVEQGSDFHCVTGWPVRRAVGGAASIGAACGWATCWRRRGRRRPGRRCSSPRWRCRTTTTCLSD